MRRGLHALAAGAGLAFGLAGAVPPADAAQPAARTARTAPAAEPGPAIAAGAHAQVGITLVYDPSYVSIPYPGGDVPAERGVCADVVIRALRAAGLDLQRAVHEDMRAHFGAYPQNWGLARPDRSIDHRRVPNLETWFRRAGHALPVTTDATRYRPGDIVSWRLPGGLAHIGVVSARRVPGSDRPLVVHNIGAGTRVEDVLFAWPPVGHFRVTPAAAAAR